jgi:peroxiredoxin
MRTLRASWAAAAWLALAPAWAGAETPDKLLKLFRPSQRDVEYDTPTDRAAIDACKVETVYKGKKPIGYALRDGQGRLLRRFVDTNGLRRRYIMANGEREPEEMVHLDQWSYYKDGFEVYREIDLNEDGSLDECRWLNSGGTRVALLKGGKVVGWKQLSAEEASKVLVQGLVSLLINTGDTALVESVLARPEELEGLGLPKDQAAAAANDRRAALAALRKALAAGGWDAQTTWYRFDGQMPHVIPADTAAALRGDVVLYENAAIFAGPSSGQGNPLKAAYLHVPELVRLGEVWKFVELPQAVDPNDPKVKVTDNGIRAWAFRQASGAGPERANPELQVALGKLAEYDGKNSPPPDADRAAVAQFHRGRIDLLREVAAKAGGDGDEQLTYDKEIVNSLAAAYQTGLYPAGGQALDKLIARGGPLGSYADFRKLLADYAAEADKPDANLMDVQKKYLARLDAFLKDHPRAEEAPEALFQLASGSEFNANEADARAYYARLVKDYPGTAVGKKAAGALKRLDLVGKPLELAGPGLDGKKVDVQSYRGKPVLVLFWSSEAPQFKADLPKYQKLTQATQDKGLTILGVNLDATRAAAESFVRDNSLPWPQIFEEGGMDGPLANEYGILTLPTMFLVDAQGKVVNRSLRTPAEVERLLEKPLAEKPVGLNLDVK